MLKMSLCTRTSAAVLFCLCTSLTAVAAEGAAPASPPPASAAAPEVNGITQAALKAGVIACTSRINQVANFLIAGTQDVKAIMLMPPANPDQQLISVSMEIPQKDASSAYASASFAPNQANGCGGMYEAVVYWPQNCTKVASETFGALKKIDGFSKQFTVLDGGPLTKIFLMSAGKGCVSIKKEVVL